MKHSGTTSRDKRLGSSSSVAVFVKQNAAWIITALLLVFALIYGLWPQPVWVDTALVVEGPMQVSIKEEGVTRAKDRYRVSVPVSGFLRRIDLSVGDAVQKQQHLTLLEPLPSEILDPRHRAEAEARVAAANSALSVARQQAEAAKANAEFASQEYQRKSKLKQQEFISEEALHAALTEKRRAEAELRSANFSVDVAKYDLQAANTLLQYSAAQTSVSVVREQVPILSPIDGVVLAINRKSEGVVSAGSPLIEIGDSSALEVAIDVLSFDAVKIVPTMKVSLQQWGGPKIDGVVRAVEPVGFTKVSALGVEEQRVWVIVDLLSPRAEWQRLGDGYRVEATFILWESDEVLQIPNSALFQRDDQWYVFKVVDAELVLQAISIDQRSTLFSKLKQGLNKDDRVVVHPSGELRAGVSVKW